MKEVEAIGIIGAGKLGIVLAQLALKAGYRVYISGSGDPSKIRLSIDVLAPGAVAARSEEVARKSDVIILALPLSAFRTLPSKFLAGKLVIDATNHWWEVDGKREEVLEPEQSSSGAIQAFLPQSRVIKALNHIGYHDLHDHAKPAHEPGRKAVAIAGDDKHDAGLVAQIVDRLGFDPLYIGRLSSGRKLEPRGNAFGASVDARTLANLLK